MQRASREVIGGIQRGIAAIQSIRVRGLRIARARLGVRQHVFRVVPAQQTSSSIV
jgi:hypothetical protein